MQIRKLRLSGFKSFVETAELRIEPGLTGVVGPNGCGKSNLLEAIRWVMGENSPKSMRSGGMDDVIFAGTATRPARDFAEVVLHAADDAGDALDVMRRIERGAGSAYRVNGRDVRAKDVALVFADAATGAHSPALVSQGKIAQVIAAKPAERRMMLEEAAGIAGLHVRRRDAELKLRQTERNLARLEDLIAGQSTQIASLRRQAKQAERYTMLTQQITAAEARMIYARWRDAASEATRTSAFAEQSEAQVSTAQQATKQAQGAQHALAARLTRARDTLADRRADATAHGHRMASLTSQLEAAEQRFADLDRQRTRLEEDKFEADRMTQDAARAMAALDASLKDSEANLARDEQDRPGIADAVDNAERASRAAELALARATADNAGLEAEWRVAEAAITQAESRLARLDNEMRQLTEQRSALMDDQDIKAEMAAAHQAVTSVQEALQSAREAWDHLRERKASLSEERDAAASRLSAARAEMAGMEREYQALLRDRQARERQQNNSKAMRVALDMLEAAPGYERALAAVLGRDAKSPIGLPEGAQQGRFWTGTDRPSPVADSLARHLRSCPDELAARLALVHVAKLDDGRALKPGEWLVTTDGLLRRWDGFIARGEGAASAARLEADNRFTALEKQLPAKRAAVEAAQAVEAEMSASLAHIRQDVIARERDAAKLAEEERHALRALDQAEARTERFSNRRAELEERVAQIKLQHAQAAGENEQAQARRDTLPDPQAGRVALEAARSANTATRASLQSAAAALAAHDQGLAVTRERVSAQRADLKGWQSRAGEAAQRLAGMAARFDEIETERAITAAKPEGLMREIEQGESVRERLTEALAQAEADLGAAQADARACEAALSDANEALSVAREARAGAIAKAQNAENRREEMARLSGDRFRCPPAMLPGTFAFDESTITNADAERDAHERLVAARERIGPVNLVAAEELLAIEEAHGASAAEQEELREAVNRLRGSIGNLNREGRERLRAAFEAVDQHFRHLFTRLFEGGQAHLALVDADDPLEAGLEIFAQPPGKRLQSLSLLSGGEQALTATALIFALFLTNPAPICVLDEVDAPLDDANIDRFCDLLDSMTSETATRYLVVTHNAVTMSRMHRLFGVTMVEKGVSRLVSVDLGEAALMAAE